MMLLLLLVVCAPFAAHAGLSRKGMAITVYNRTPFTIRLVEVARIGKTTNSEMRIHYVKPNDGVSFSGKDVRV